MNRKFLLLLATATLPLTGCSSLPHATIGYYLPKSQADITVIRTVSCDANQNPIIANAVIPSVTHAASDNKDDFVLIDLSKVRGAFSDSDVKFDFYDDGRLQSFNSINTGQGEAILKTTISIGAAAIALESPETDIESPFIKECKFIKDTGKGDPLTIKYHGSLSLNNNSLQAITPDHSSTFYESNLRNILGKLFGQIGRVPSSANIPVLYEKKDHDAVLKARHPGIVNIGVLVKNSMSPATDSKIWKGDIHVSQFGTLYDIPIPKPALFGKTTLATTFSESGALTSIQYAGESGTSQALSVSDALLAEFEKETTAEEANQVKAEADLIAQQQRLVKCKANPEKCE
ncbi:hypothetical protein [Desulfogranum marinum]|uniref:hypothetical protein n=1 Tax=Desulfogranum marinum TaxID=453220 RepID=UPI0029C7F5ED|nr:hypothetical protein [Desulfogranum marinum]